MANWWDEAPTVDNKSKPGEASWWSAAPQARTTDEQIARAQAPTFPTPGQTAMTALGGAGRALLGVPLAVGRMALEAPVKPFLEAYRMAKGDLPEGYQNAQALVEGTKRVLTPAYKAATGGVGTVTPEEMEKAAETGGGAVAGLGTPLLPKGARAVGTAAGKAGITGANVVKVLKFTGETAKKVASHPVGGAALGALTGDMGAAALGAVGAPVMGRILSSILGGRAGKLVGNIATDKALTAVTRGNLAEAGQIVAKALEKNPEAAEAAAEAVASAASKPPVGRLRVPPEVEARAMEASRQRIAAHRKRLGLDQPAKTTPQAGKVRMPTVYSNPRTPAGKPLTQAQRNAALEELQMKAAEAEGIDLFEAFGMTRPN